MIYIDSVFIRNLIFPLNNLKTLLINNKILKPFSENLWREISDQLPI